VYGMDYEETFAHMSKMTTICTLIVVTSSFQWKIFQMDVKNSFLSRDLHEEVYMIPPLGVSYKSGEVLKLQKALYGIKQPPRAWFQKFSTLIVSLGFVVVIMILYYLSRKPIQDVFCYPYMLMI